MDKIKWMLAGLILSISVLWMSADSFFLEPFSYFSFRSGFNQYSGIVAMILMSFGMMLSLRLKHIDDLLGGLDKTYRLHKLLGVSVLIFSVMHWWFAQGTKWMVGWGWLEKPIRKAKAPIEDQVLLFLQSQKGLAETLGEISFYAFVVILAIALVKFIPYRIFRYSHRLISPLYLLLVFHAVILAKFSYWTQPIGILLALFMLCGSIAAVIDITGNIGKKRQVAGTITQVEHVVELNVVQVTVKVAEGWQGHQAGQFAFVTSKKSEGAHPYTIASSWDATTAELSFIIKGLGDWTNQLSTWLKVGMPVMVEGPYGNFTFDDSCSEQIWVGAGIGITPFIAKMKQRAGQVDVKPITLFYCTKKTHPEKLALLKQIAAEANVNLHVFNAENDEFLNSEKLQALAGNWQQSSLWFCGPAAFGLSLKQDMAKRGLSSSRFHQELFEFR